MKWSHILRRAVIVWLVTAVSVTLLSFLLDSFEVEGWRSALGMAAVFGLLNSLIWPFLIRIALPLTVLTLGFGVLLLNGLVVVLASQVESTTIQIDSIFSAIVIALGITLVNTFLLGALSIDDDDFYYLNVIKRNLRRRYSEPAAKVKKGVFFLEIDGLAHDVLMRAISDGNAPTMAKWLRSGTHKLVGWETDWSSQTGAMQAGILHGNNDNMPAFRWYEKDKKKFMVSNRPKDAMEIESRHSDGHGLLSKYGASRANLLSGDAPYSLLTMSTVLKKDRQGRIGEDYYTFFANPYNLLRTVMLTVQDIAVELYQARQQRKLDIQPRVHRGFVYALLRAWTTVVQRDLQVQAIIGDILVGRPLAYTTFLGYDEVAHHSGIERIDALVVLRKIDKQFKRIEAAFRLAPIEYELVILSDHGQTQGSTFLQRYGHTLEDFINQQIGEDTVVSKGKGDESSSSLDTSLTEVSQGTGIIASAARLFRKNDATNEKNKAKTASTIVMASGCLGLVYFNKISRRATYEQINKLHPGLIQALVDHPGIGFVLVETDDRGPVVIAKEGMRYIKSGQVEGQDPLAEFGENAVIHVARTSSFKYCADIMINSTYWPETREVAAFEELVGSHGGMGGTQNHPFVLYPSTWQAPNSPIVGAENLHKQLKTWLKN